MTLTKSEFKMMEEFLSTPRTYDEMMKKFCLTYRGVRIRMERMREEGYIISINSEGHAIHIPHTYVISRLT